MKYSKLSNGEKYLNKIIKENKTLLNERPCGGNPLKFNLGGGWDVSFDIDPDVSVFPLNINLGGGSYSCKFTYTFRQGPSSGPPINDADEIYDVAIQSGYSPENAEGMVEVARKKMRQIERRRGSEVRDRFRGGDFMESDFSRIIKRVINEQGSAFDWSSSLDGWDIQKDAREEGRYCEDYPDNHVGPRYFEGQYCKVQTNWYDWESSPGVETKAQGASGEWQCGVGCMVSLKEG